jgi:hypothetical protein
MRIDSMRFGESLRCGSSFVFHSLARVLPPEAYEGKRQEPCMFKGANRVASFGGSVLLDAP